MLTELSVQAVNYIIRISGEGNNFYGISGRETVSGERVRDIIIGGISHTLALPSPACANDIKMKVVLVQLIHMRVRTQDDAAATVFNTLIRAPFVTIGLLCRKIR